MKIIWLGHGSFRFEIAGQTLLLDPWLSGNPVLPEDQHDAAIAGASHILLTHTHFDHVVDVVPLAKKLNIPAIGQYDIMNFWAEAESIETIGFNKGGTVDLGDVKVAMVPASHSSTFQTAEGLRTGGSEVGFMIMGEGKTVYASGDTAIMADMAWMADYFKPEVGILSAGGHFTMDMAQAAYAANTYFNFETVIPCHYKTFPRIQIWAHTTEGHERDPESHGATLSDANGKFRLEMPQIVPAFGQPHGHLAYDDGKVFETVFLRPMVNPVSHGHIAYRTDDIEAFKKRLDDHGVPYADWGNRAVAGWSQIFFYDPDGNVIEVHQVDE